MTPCTTRLSPAPKSRRKVGAFRANEIDEWGLYCTADATVITLAQAEDEAGRDFNAICAANDAPDQSTNCENSSSPGTVLGGAVAGDIGAALSAMLGGFGKKKKKAGC